MKCLVNFLALWQEAESPWNTGKCLSKFVLAIYFSEFALDMKQTNSLRPSTIIFDSEIARGFQNQSH